MYNFSPVSTKSANLPTYVSMEVARFHIASSPTPFQTNSSPKQHMFKRSTVEIFPEPNTHTDTGLKTSTLFKPFSPHTTHPENYPSLILNNMELQQYSFHFLLVTVILRNQGYIGIIFLMHYSRGLFPLSLGV